MFIVNVRERGEMVTKFIIIQKYKQKFLNNKILKSISNRRTYFN